MRYLQSTQFAIRLNYFATSYLSVYPRDLLDADGEQKSGFDLSGESSLSVLFREEAVESPVCARAERPPTLGFKAPQEASPHRTKAPTATAGTDNRRAASVKRAPRARAIVRPAPRRLSRATTRQSGQGPPDPPWLRAWSVLLRHVTFQEDPPHHFC